LRPRRPDIVPASPPVRRASASMKLELDNQSQDQVGWMPTPARMGLPGIISTHLEYAPAPSLDRFRPCRYSTSEDHWHKPNDHLWKLAHTMDTISDVQYIAREAKALVALAFRSGPIEDVQAGRSCPT